MHISVQYTVVHTAMSRDASPERAIPLHYSQYGPLVFKWSELRSWVEDKSLYHLVDIEFMLRFSQHRWKTLAKQSRVGHYARSVVVLVLLENLPHNHVFYCRLNCL